MATRKVPTRSSKTSRLHITAPRPSQSNAHRNASATSHGILPRATIDLSTTAHLNQSQKRFNRLSFNLQSRANSELEYGSDASSDGGNTILDEIIGSSWRTHEVSPLFNLQVDQTCLKLYGKYMRETLSCNSVHRGKAIEYHAYFTWFGSDSDDNFTGLQVEVKTTSGDEPAKTAYKGFLLSSLPLAHLPECFVHLPVLLSKSTNNMTQSVHDILHQLFDCIITQMQIPQSELMWLSAMLNSDQDRDKQKDDAIRFIYRISENNNKDTITVCLPTNAVVVLWQRVHSSASSLVTHEEVKSFHDDIYLHIQETQRLILKNCIFVKFFLPTLTMDTNGSVKMFTKYSAIQTLTFIQGLTNTFENLKVTWT